MNKDFDGREEKKLLFAVCIEEEKFLLEQEMELLELGDNSDANSNFLFTKANEVTLEDSSQTSTSGNRRYGLRPKKRTALSYCDDSLFDIVENSSNPAKKICMSHPNNGCLETIFEHPKVAKNGNLLVLAKSKIKRFISFNDFVTKTKNKHRKLKVKRLVKSKGEKPSRPKITLEDVKLKLKLLEDSTDEDESMDISNM